MKSYQFKSNRRYFLKNIFLIVIILFISLLFTYSFRQSLLIFGLFLAADIIVLLFIVFILKRVFQNKALVITEKEIIYFGKKLIDVSNIDYVRVDYQINSILKKNEAGSLSATDASIKENLEFIIKPKNIDTYYKNTSGIRKVIDKLNGKMGKNEGECIFRNFNPSISVTGKELLDAFVSIGVSVK